MCGIVGYVGQEPARPFLLEGLKRLEYRGYDSFGFATIFEKQLWYNHFVGSLSTCANLQYARIPGNLGIGHTRWATHGAATEKNTHPVNGLYTAVVHNGTVENYTELRRELESRGFVFDTDTDTEVIAHLIDQKIAAERDARQREHHFNVPRVLHQTLRQVLRRLHGQNAFAVISPYFPDYIALATSGPPLLLSGKGYFASDKNALAGYTSTACRLHADDVAVMGQDYLTITHLGSGPKYVYRPVEDVPEVCDTQMGDYPHFMLKEIAEQGGLQEKVLRAPAYEGPNLIERIVMFGCGSSYNAALLGKWYTECFGMPVEVEYASEMLAHRLPEYGSHTLFVALSQSGETRDTLDALARLEAPLDYRVGITNNRNSTLAHKVGHLLDIAAGPEQGVAATKTFLAQALTLYKLADVLCKRVFVEHPVLTGELQRLWQHRGQLEHMARVIKDYQHILLLGSGWGHAVAREGALKLKEVAYIHAEALPAAEMKHGPIALIDDDTLSIFILGNQSGLTERIITNMHEIKARGGRILAIGHSLDYPRLQEVADHILRYDTACHQQLSPLVTTVMLQLLTYYVAVQRGLNVDRPRNLAKSVTV